MTTDDDRRTALHESAHFVCDLELLGDVAAVVSINRVAAHRGMVIRSGARRLDFSGHDRERELFSQDPGLRATAEAAIVCVLAGRVAEDMFARVYGYQDDRAPEAAERLATSLAQLSPRDLELLTDAEARPEAEFAVVEGDAAVAAEVSFLLVGQESAAHIAWLTAVTRRFVERHAVPILALAEELLRTPVLSGDHAASIATRASGLPTEAPTAQKGSP